MATERDACVNGDSVNSQAVANERIRILFKNAHTGGLSVMALALLFAYLQREQYAASVLTGWVSSIALLVGMRLWLNADYNLKRSRREDHNVFEKRLIVLVGLTGLVWAIVIGMGLSLESFEHRIYSMLILVGLAAMAMPVFAPSLWAFYAYILPSYALAIPLLLARGGDDAALGAASCVFLFVIVTTGRNFNKSITDSLSLRFRAEKTTEALRNLEHEHGETERRIQDLVNGAPIAIYVRDLEGRFTLVNENIAGLLHMPCSGMIGKTLYDILPDEVADPIRQNDLEVMHKGESIEYEESAPVDGERRLYLSVKFPMRDKSGKIYGVGGVSTDITDRQRMQESLRISQQRLQLYHQQSSVGIIEWGPNFEFLEWNPTAERIFGFSREEVQGKRITDRILPESAKPIVDAVWEQLISRTGGMYSLNENLTKDGRTILCEWRNTPLVDSSGKVIGVTSLVEDVTMRQQTQEKMRLVQKMDALGKVTGGIAHDFNNALGVIIGYCELIQLDSKEDPNSGWEYLKEIMQAALRSKNLTAKLLAFSRKTATISEKTDVNEVLENSKDMLERTLTPRVRLSLDLDPDLGFVFLDKSGLEDAVLNMGINAMHAMPQGGSFMLRTRNVELSQKDVAGLGVVPGRYIRFTLSDTGEGMDDDTRQQIFDPFFTTKGAEGTGLGMSQVYGFVQQSKGAITVDSEVGFGTSINLYFPRLSEGKEDFQADVKGTAGMDFSGTENILVVDDEQGIRDLIRAVLEKSGYRVLLADSGQRALSILESESVDLMLSDIIMQGMDGHQLVREALERNPNLKIQLMSGFNDRQHSHLIDQRFDRNLLSKPFSMQALLACVRGRLDAEE